MDIYSHVESMTYEDKVYIDAWKSEDAEREAVAYVEVPTKEIHWLEESAKEDSLVKLEINLVMKDIDAGDFFFVKQH